MMDHVDTILVISMAQKNGFIIVVILETLPNRNPLNLEKSNG